MSPARRPLHRPHRPSPPRQRLPLSRWLPPACTLLAIGAPASALAQTTPGAPTLLSADRMRSSADRETVAEGAVELRQGGLLLRSDRLTYRPPTDRAVASGNVRIENAGSVYRGTELELAVQDFSGWFIAPEFDFPLLGTRGQAARIDFASRTRLTATDGSYTSCPADGSGAEPDWLLTARSLKLDFDANEGIAEGAVLRFLGVPILALPSMSFPVTGARKSGWLPPTVDLDSRSGFDVSVPYYWNAAPNRDLTIAPRIVTRRGIGAELEARYLEPGYAGTATLDALPNDRLADRSRYALSLRHDQAWADGTLLQVAGVRVSDSTWWKDFPRGNDSLTPRLLQARTAVERPFAWSGIDFSAYAQVQHWQVLQDADAPIVAPYARAPQLGLRGLGAAGPFDLAFETEANRFERPADDSPGDRLEGLRWHGIAAAALPLRWGGARFVPGLSLNAAHYRTDTPMSDGRRSASRLIPTLSLDAALEFERETSAYFGRRLRQTLEPRVLYVRTRYARQDRLPNFDAFAKEFNVSSIYATNAFSGVDRVTDANQLTAGATTRLLDPDSGAEVLRLDVAQRFLFDDQRVAPQPDGSADGPPLQQKFSDVLVVGSTRLLPGWALDAALQYSPEISRLARSVLGATWSPGPFRTLSGRYRLARDVSEQIELGWQWPLWGPGADAGHGGGGGGASGSGCRGTWYGVGRINYSLRDSRMTDSILGAEYDAGCWIARVVSERLSTGRSEATTRLLLQLELTGLSRLGSNPLRVLKDNIPGYRLLREERDGDSLVPAPTTP